jgi:hypothetical protein
MSTKLRKQQIADLRAEGYADWFKGVNRWGAPRGLDGQHWLAGWDAAADEARGKNSTTCPTCGNVLTFET